MRKLEFAFLSDESKPQLYIHEVYNVRAYKSPTKEGESENFIVEIRNEIVNTILRKVILPKIIIILLSSKKLDDPVFSIECMEGLLRWLLDEIDDILKFQKRVLPDKSKKLDAPRVYFLKILPKPNDAKGNNLFKGVRRKFNTTLQTMLESYHFFGFINVHEITTRAKDEKFFISNQSGILSDEGAIQFWDSISQTIKAIDHKNKPKTITKNQYTQWSQNDSNRAAKLDKKNDINYRRQAYQKQDYRRFENSERYSARPHYNDSYYY